MPDSRKVAVGLILIMVVVVVAIVVIASLGIDIGIGGGYKVNVTGRVSKDFGGAVHVHFSDATHSEDPGIFSVSPMFIFNAENVLVEVTLQFGTEEYKAEQDLGSVSHFGDTKSFSIDVRHIPPGDYAGTITVYNIKKSLFGFGWEESRTLLDSTTFAIFIEEGEE